MKRASLSLFAVALAACHSEPVTVQAQLTVSSHAQLRQTLTIHIDVDDNKNVGEASFADAQDNTVTVAVGVSTGTHVFQVRVESSSYPGITLLESDQKTFEINSDNNPVAFGPNDFSDDFDNDNNGLNNWEEFKLGCHPSSTDCEWLSVSAGREHTCAIKSDGTLYCFGANDSDQLGSSGEASTTPRAIPGLMWSQVAAGGGHTCAIEKDTTQVYCWGDGSYGQVGDNTTSGRVSPHPIDDLLARKIAVGAHTSCAIDTQGALWCWGVKLTSPLDPQPIPSKMDEDFDWTDLAVGYEHACGIRNGRLWCWGGNEDHQVGASDAALQLFSHEVLHPDGSAWTHVAAGATNTCAIDADTGLWCWGDNAEHELSVEDPGQESWVPYRIGMGGSQVDWLSVSVGEDHVCAVQGQGLKCWGWNKQGRVGHQDHIGIPVGITEPSAFSPEDTVWSVSAGASHTCGVRNGELYCWGAHGWGKTGLGLSAVAHDPTMVIHPQGAGWQSVMAGENHTCAIDNNDGLSCWGDNSYGALQHSVDYRSVDSQAPVEVGGTYSEVACGNGFTCALETTSPPNLFCWGANGAGQVGNGSLEHQVDRYGVNPPASRDWLHITAGAHHMCGITRDQATPSDQYLYCWGDNREGAIGQGSTSPTEYATPTAITEGSTWTSVTAGNGFTCGIDAGDRYCWGKNDMGQLGLGDIAPRHSPVLTTNGWVDPISAGEAHACGLYGSILYCWGYDENGQVGDSGSYDAAVMTPVTVAGAWTDMVAGSGHTCARDTGTQITCWGENGYGQLGDIGPTRNAPGAPMSNSWNQLTAGAYHTCAVSSGAQLFCWGSNEVGQLGIGNAWADTPQRVN